MVTSEALQDTLTTLLQARLSDPTLTVQALAAHLQLSPRQLQRVVRRETGRSPKALLTEARLTAARDLLLRGRYATVAEIAAAVGWTPNHLSRAYADAFGRPPSADLRS